MKYVYFFRGVLVEEGMATLQSADRLQGYYINKVKDNCNNNNENDNDNKTAKMFLMKINQRNC